MLRQLLVGGAVSIVNITIHALVMTTVVRVAQAARVHRDSHPSLFLMVVMIPTVSILMITHTVEVIVWALAYWIVGAAPPGSNLVDFAFVNFTTLGYGHWFGETLASAWPNYGNERFPVIRVVDCGHFCSAAESISSCRQYIGRLIERRVRFWCSKRHCELHCTCPLLGVKQIWLGCRDVR